MRGKKNKKRNMVCPGGEKAFITRIIEDSIVLKESFRWCTSMVGRKTNLKISISKLWEVGVTIVKTSEFVQGQTCRWGLAWSVVPPARNMISPHVAEKSIISFMLEITASNDQIDAFLKNEGNHCDGSVNCNYVEGISNCSILNPPLNNLSFRISVFQQVPGTLLLKGSLQNRNNPVSGVFSSIIQHLEGMLRYKFCRAKPTVKSHVLLQEYSHARI